MEGAGFVGGELLQRRVQVFAPFARLALAVIHADDLHAIV
jgi:hypothetical protein